MAQIRVELGDASMATALFEPICVLYDEVFSQPPFFWRDDESQLHRDRLTKLLSDPSFGIAVARHHDELVGFAYGYALKPDSRWWQGFAEPLPADLTAEWPGRTFVLFDYGVSATHRGRGIGHALHHTLLRSRTEQRATLATEPSNTSAQQIYEHWGWRPVGRCEGGPTASSPWFDIYLRDRLDDLAAD